MEPREEKIVCGAKTKSGKPCQKRPMKGRTRCRLHGGLSPMGGPGHPTYKHGRYSKYTNRVSSERVQRLRQIIEGDEDPLNMTPEIAITTMRIEELIGNLDTNETQEVWKELNRLRSKMVDAVDKEQYQAMPQYVKMLDRLITAGYQNATAYTEIQKWLETKRAIVATETKRVIAAEEMMPKDRAVALVSMMETGIHESLRDVLGSVEGGKELETAVLRAFTLYLRRNVLSDGKEEAL